MIRAASEHAPTPAVAGGVTTDEVTDAEEFTPPWVGNPRLRWLDRIVGFLVALQLVLAVLLVAVVTVLRYGFAIGVPWSIEATKVLLAGIVFLGSAMALHRGEHRSMRLVIEFLPARVVAAIDSFNLILIGAVGAALAYGGYQWSATVHGPILGTELPLSLMAVPIAVGSVVLVLYSLGLLLSRSFKANFWGMIGAVVFVATCWLIAQSYPGLDGLETAVVLFLLLFIFLIVLGMPVGFCFAVGSLGIIYGLDGIIPLEGVARRYSENASSFVLSAVPFFIAAGLIMESGDITRRIIAVANAFLRHFRGHVGHVTIGSMYFMSGVTGSESADVAAVGAVMRKPMRIAGFKAGESTGILVAAAVMGATVPPSIGLIIIASSAQVSVSSLFLAGFLPAAFLAAILSLTVYFRARAQGMKPAPQASWRERGTSLRKATLAMGLPIIVIGGMVGGFGTPTELSAFALLYVVVIEVFIHRSVRWKQVYRVTVNTAVMTGMLLFIVAAASSLVYVSTFATVPQKIGQFLTDISGSTQVFFLLLTILALIPLGMLMEGIAALLVFPPLLMPAAIELGIDPVHYSILMFLAVVIGANMPPIGAGFYFGSAVMGADIRHSTRPTFMYLGIVTLGLLVIAFIPAVTLIVPQLFGMD